MGTIKSKSPWRIEGDGTGFGTKVFFNDLDVTSHVNRIEYVHQGSHGPKLMLTVFNPKAKLLGPEVIDASEDHADLFETR